MFGVTQFCMRMLFWMKVLKLFVVGVSRKDCMSMWVSWLKEVLGKQHYFLVVIQIFGQKFFLFENLLVVSSNLLYKLRFGNKTLKLVILKWMDD